MDQAELLGHRNKLEYLEDISLSEHQPQHLPFCLPTADSYLPTTSSYIPEDFHPSGNFSREALNDVSEPLSTQASLLSTNYHTQTFNAGSEQSIAQVSEETELFQDLSILNDILPAFYNVNNMVQENEQHSRNQDLTDIDKNPLLECTFPGCEDRVFPNKFALKKHKDKHTRPYTCTYPSCNLKSFGDKGSLDRHSREVHSSVSYTCPVQSCPRSKRGFNRRYNLWEHQKRRHRLDPSKSPQSYCSASEESSRSEIAVRNVEQENNSLELNGDETNQSLAVPEGEDITGDQTLHTKLRNLRNLRAEIDGDIISLEKALRIMGGVC